MSIDDCRFVVVASLRRFNCAGLGKDIISFFPVRYSTFVIRHSLSEAHRLSVLSGIRCSAVTLRQALDDLGTAIGKDF